MSNIDEDQPITPLANAPYDNAPAEADGKLPTSYFIQRDSLLIYGLMDPRSHEIRYIGKSSTGLQRAITHQGTSKIESDTTHKARWIRELIRAGFEYVIVVLERCNDRQHLADAEEHWIYDAVQHGWPLTNARFGDHAVSEVSAETRAKISAANKGRARPDLLGKKRPDLTARMLAGQSRQMLVARERKSRKGISNVKLIGIPRSPEVRAKIGAAGIGRPQSAEQRAKKSASLKIAWARRKAAAATAKSAQTPLAIHSSEIENGTHCGGCHATQSGTDITG